MAEEQKKKSAPAQPTEYIIQRRPALDIREADFEESVRAGLDQLWEDVTTVTASGALAAIKMAHGEGEDAIPGEYRAFPARSDNRLSVSVEQQVAINYGSANGQRAASTKETASAP